MINRSAIRKFFKNVYFCYWFSASASTVPATPSNYGTGQINPNAIADAGLVYNGLVSNISGLGNNTSILALTGKVFVCPAIVPTSADLQ
jgi:hypothetical protein